MPVPIEILNKFPKLSNEQLMINLSNPTGKNKLIIDTDTANEIDDHHEHANAHKDLRPERQSYML